MKPALRIPATLACTFVLGAGALAAVALGCEGGESPPQEAGIEAGPSCDAFCVPDGTDAGVCPTDPVECADPAGNCPPGCTPVG